MLSVDLLGPLRVFVNGRQVDITAPTLRTLVVVLAVGAGRQIPVDRLASVLWGYDLPVHPRRAVQTHLTRLRGLLNATHLRTGPGGYELYLGPDQVDALRFIGLLDSAARSTDVIAERADLTTALDLWRGDPFEDLNSEWLARLRDAYVERYLAAVERLADLDLADGRHGDLVTRLQGLVDAHPLRESLWVRLLTALDRAGRRAEALTRYESIRVRLSDELGADPGAELQRVYGELLAGGSTPPGTSPAARAQIVPRQLPADIAGFTGRAAALRTLDAWVDAPEEAASTATRISSITGMAGIGKTALAVHWAHGVADRFPDGQLYVNLHGFDPSERVMEPAQALRVLLDAFGVPAEQIPADPEAQTALYRTLLADRKVLVVLDNARDSEQVRPLLPGGPTCLVLVTSRARLTGLVATGSARPLILEPMCADEARNLLAARLGAERIGAEAAAVRTVVARCAGLPLALALIAARVATSPVPLTTAAAELDDQQVKLDTLDVGDPAVDVRRVFSWSYRALTPPAARLFRLLGMHPGPDIALAAVTSLAAATTRQVRRLLIELGDAGLIAERTSGRYVIHDLLRTYAAELSGSGDAGEGRAGRRRLLDHYVHPAYAAALLLNPRRDPVALPPAARGVAPETLTDVDGAVRWFTREHRVLTAAVCAAAAAGFDAHTWQLAWTLNDFLYKQGHWRDRISTYKAALSAGQRLSDRTVQIAAHHGLAGAYLRLGADADADTHLRAEVELLRADGDRVAQARVHLGIAQLMDRRTRHDAARDHATEATTLYRTAGHRTGQATALNMVGWCELRLGNPERAVTCCKQAIEIQEETADPEAASTWDTLGCAYQELGRHTHAAECFRRALDLSRTVGDRYYEAFVLGHLGDTHRATGDDAAARNAWQTALDVLTRFGHPDAAELRKKIDDLPGLPRQRTQQRYDLVRSLTQR